MPTAVETMLPILLVLSTRRRQRRAAESVLVSALPMPTAPRTIFGFMYADRVARREEREKEELAREAVAAIEVATKKTGTGTDRLLTAAEFGAFTRLNALMTRPALKDLRAKILTP